MPKPHATASVRDGPGVLRIDWISFRGHAAQRVTVDGRAGRVTGAHGGYVYVRFSGNAFSLPCHPTWRFECGEDKR